MTKTQHSLLSWLDTIGGTCVAWRDKVAHPLEAEARSKKVVARHASIMQRQLMPAVSALHLVQSGHIVAANGKLYITDKGRAALRPFA